jgi:hypothetical protein
VRRKNGSTAAGVIRNSGIYRQMKESLPARLSLLLKEGLQLHPVIKRWSLSALFGIASNDLNKRCCKGIQGDIILFCL